MRRINKKQLRGTEQRLYPWVMEDLYLITPTYNERVKRRLNKVLSL